VAKDVPARDAWSVAVFPLDDSEAERLAADYALFGATGGQGSGAVAARAIARAFAAHPNLRPVSDAALRSLLRDENLTLRDLALADDGRACELGRRLNADMVVRGRVAAYRTSWFLFVPRSQIILELRGMDPRLSRLLWAARVESASHLDSEAELVAQMAEQVILRLHAVFHVSSDAAGESRK
jgi:hypothetical protein